MSNTFDPHTNFAYSTVKAGSTIIGSTGNPKTIILETGDGADFPGGDGTTEFNVELWPSGQQPRSSNAEIARVTRSGDTLTTTARGEESTTPLGIVAVGYQVMAGVSKKWWDDVEGHYPVLDYLVNQLSGDVAMASANTWYDGPSLTLTAGTWLLVANVTVQADVDGGSVTAKLWDGASAVAGSSATWVGASDDVGFNGVLSLVGVVVVAASETWKASVASDSPDFVIKAAASVNPAGNTASMLAATRIQF